MLSNERRLRLLLIASGALLVTRLILMPLIGWQNDLAAENQRLGRQLAKAELRIADAPAMIERQYALKAIIKNSEGQLANGEDKTKLMQQRGLEQLFKDVDLTLRSFNWILAEMLPEGHGRLRAEANLAGSLTSFIKGTHALSTRTPHTEVVSIDLRLNQREQQMTGRGLIGTILIDVVTVPLE